MTKPNFREYVLGAMPGTKSHLVARSGVSLSAVLKWVRIMHAAREIYISGWKKHPRGGPHMPVFSIGNLPDAKCRLKSLTMRQIRLRYEAKAKADGRYDRVQAHSRSRYWLRKAAALGDPMTSALFGAPAAREAHHG